MSDPAKVRAGAAPGVGRPCDCTPSSGCAAAQHEADVHDLCDEVETLRSAVASLQARVDAARAAVAGAQFSSVRQVNRLGEAVEKALEGK